MLSSDVIAKKYYLYIIVIPFNNPQEVHMKIVYLSLFLVFCSAPAIHGFELIIIGDSRSGAGNEYFQRTREVMNDAIAYTERNYQNLSGIVMTGDYVKSGTNDEQWVAWIDANTSAFDYPIYPCPGNHDDENAACEWSDIPCEQEAYYTWNYYNTFNVERWWSTDIERLHLISLDSNLEGFDDETHEGDLLEELQYDWFKNDLETNGSRPTLVFWHDPAYASYSWFGKGHGSNGFMRNRYVSLCEQYNVKMIAYGHNHWYERFTVNGIKHVTTGGGGAPLLPVPFVWDRAEGSEVNKVGYHWCVISVRGDLMTVKVIQHRTHRILDSFEVDLGH
jgi:hypothetical protein